MSITTNAKINEMMNHNKADATVLSTYLTVEREHNLASNTRDLKKNEMNHAKANYEQTKENARNTSLLHPVRKYRAIRAEQNAKRQYDQKKREYQIAKHTLKDSQRKLRAMRSEVRHQYKNYKQMEKMNKRVDAIQNGHYISMSIEDAVAHANQVTRYHTQMYHIDTNNPAKSTFISTPDQNLVKNIHHLYANHLIEKGKSNVKKAVKEVSDKAHQIEGNIKNTSKKRDNTNDLGWEM